MLDLLARSIFIGVVATALLDVWAIFLQRAFGIPRPNWGMVGRWFAHLPRGRFVHADIGASEPVANELTVGWVMHYVVGVVFALALLLWAGPAWSREPTFLPALVVGLVTVGAGWFILQPGLGIGVAASKKPNANQIRMLNIVGHVVFAIGLYGGALLLS